MLSLAESITPDDIILIRELAGMDREQFAKSLGCSEMAISRWERGRCKPDQVYVRQMVKMKAELLDLIQRPDEFRRHIEKVTEGE